MKKIKIIYIIDVFDNDMAGTENQLKKIISGLNKSTFQVHLVCFGNSPWFHKNHLLLECGSTVIEMNRFKRPMTYVSLARLVKFLRNQNPDIVHTFFPVGNSVGVIAARLAGIKNIISSRRDYGEWMNGRYLAATRFANKFVGKIIANSREVKKLTQEKEKICDDKVEVILNGIDTALFKKTGRDHDLKRRLNIPHGDKVVGIVANFRPMKHHYTFLKAAVEILKTRKDVSFMLVGQGQLHQEVMAFGKSLGVSHKLCFTGPQTDVLPFLSIMDVGVNCSEGEGLSNAIMEYMATGVPCVVSRAGGNPDLITHEVNGYTFELDDYKSSAELTLRLLNGDVVRDKFIKNAREKIEKELSIERMLLNYEELYINLTQGTAHY